MELSKRNLSVHTQLVKNMTKNNFKRRKWEGLENEKDLSHR